MKTYRYTDATNTVAAVFDDDGISRMSVLASTLPDGTEILSYVEPPLTPEQQREQAKAARQTAVENIKVTTAAGNTFDGDETSQTRMARAITVLSTGYAATVPWVLADNTVIQADIAELTEALSKAGAAQAALWVI